MFARVRVELKVRVVFRIGKIYPYPLFEPVSVPGCVKAIWPVVTDLSIAVIVLLRCLSIPTLPPDNLNADNTEIRTGVAQCPADV